MIRTTYAWGYRSRVSAEDAIEHMFAAGEVSQSEAPKAETYRTKDGRRLWRVTLANP